jgi:competence protein ComEC
LRGYFYLCCFAGMAAGIVAARFLHIAAFPVCAALLLVSTAVCLARRRVMVAVVVPVCFVLLGTLSLCVADLGMQGGFLARAARHGASASVSGRVLSPPVTTAGSTGFFVEVHEAEIQGVNWKMKERVQLSVDGRFASEAFFPGVNIEARGRLALPGTSERWLSDHGCACVMRASATSVRRAPPGPDIVSRGVAASRRYLSRAYRLIFDERLAGFIEGVTLSKLDRTDPAIIADLRACGLSHIVAVSGLHVSSAAVLALVAMAAVGASRRSRFIVAGMMAFAVLALSNFRPSAMRAAIMAAACCGGAMMGRRYDSLVGVSVAGIAILCANPRALLDQTFQYSFAAAIGIVLAMSRTPRGGQAGKARMALAVCAGAQLGILPLIVCKTQPVPVSAIAANLLVVWLVGALLVSSWLAALLTSLSLPLARLAAGFPAGVARYVLAVASACARVPGAGIFMGTLSVCALLLYAASLVMFARRARTGSLFRPFIALGLSVLLVLCACFPILGTAEHASVVILDVDEGDATVLRSPMGSVVLVDGGPDPDTIVGKLQSHGISRIDLMVATHPHSDHSAGLVEVVRRMPVGRLLEPGLRDQPPGPYKDLLASAKERGVATTVAREGQVITVDQQVSIEVLYAPASLKASPGNLNDSSIVSIADVGGFKVLLSGDIESTGQKTLLGAHPSLDCDMIKIPHQGAANAATPELLDAARPRLATISVGRHNTFGHPSARCLTLLASRGIRVERTDLSGDIEISRANDRIEVKTRRR